MYKAIHDIYLVYNVWNGKLLQPKKNGQIPNRKVSECANCTFHLIINEYITDYHQVFLTIKNSFQSLCLLNCSIGLRCYICKRFCIFYFGLKFKMNLLKCQMLVFIEPLKVHNQRNSNNMVQCINKMTKQECTLKHVLQKYWGNICTTETKEQ